MKNLFIHVGTLRAIAFMIVVTLLAMSTRSSIATGEVGSVDPAVAAAHFIPYVPRANDLNGEIRILNSVAGENNGQIAYVNSDGGQGRPTQAFTLDGIQDFLTRNIPRMEQDVPDLSPNLTSLVVSTDGPVASLITWDRAGATPPGIYRGTSSPSETLFLGPILRTHAQLTLWVQNASSNQADIAVDFIALNGTVVSQALLQSLNPNASQHLDLPDSLPANFVGWARLSGATGNSDRSVPLSALLLQTTNNETVALDPARQPPISSTSPAATNHTVLVPGLLRRVFIGNAYRTTQLLIGNPNATLTNFTVTFHPRVGTEVKLPPITLSHLDAELLDLGSLLPLPDGAYAATIESNQPLYVGHVTLPATQGGIRRGGYGMDEASDSFSLPRVVKSATSNSIISLQSATCATVHLTYSSNQPDSDSVTSDVTLPCQGQLQIDSSTVSALGTDFSGTLHISSNVPVRAWVDEYSTSTTPTPAPPDPNKPTIVFVHGFNFSLSPSVDPDAYFESVDDELRRWYNIEYAYLETSLLRTPSLEDNVPNLVHAIDLAKQRTGQSKVILVAHSMGGLVARAYIEGKGTYHDDVSELFTFGSPHQGIPYKALKYLLSVPPAFALTALHLHDNLPGALDMSITRMAAINRDLPARKDSVIYHTITGNLPSGARTVFGHALDALIPGDDDGVTPVSSGRGLPGRMDRLTIDEAHNTDVGTRSYFIRHGTLSDSYSECLKVVLVDKSAKSCGVNSAVQSAQSPPAESAAYTPFEQGTLLTGETVTRSVMVEGSNTVFTAHWLYGNLSLHLIDPTGKLIDPASALAQPNLILYQATDLGAAYFFTNTLAGTWQMVIHATSAPPEGSAFSAFAAFDSDLSLTTGMDSPWYAPGTTALITASISLSNASASVTATTLGADGSTATTPLIPLGGGLYQAHIAVPDATGYAEAQINATGTTAEGTPFARESSLLFQVMSDQFALNGSYKDSPYQLSPSQPYYAGIAITVGVSAEVAGTIGLSAQLHTANNQLVAHSYVSPTVVAGTNSIVLRFSGEGIYAARLNGPFILTKVLLTDKRAATIVAADADQVHTTAAYRYDQFGPSGSIIDHTYIPSIMNNPPTGIHYFHDFSTPNNDWPTWEDANARVSYQDGKYEFLVKNSGWNWRVPAPEPDLSAATIDFDIQLREGKLLVHGLTLDFLEQNVSYAFFLDDQQQFAVQKLVNNQWQDLHPWQPSTAIRPATTVNHLRIEYGDGAYAFYANDQLLASGTDLDLQGKSNSGLFIATYPSSDLPVITHFDNVSIQSPP